MYANDVILINKPETVVYIRLWTGDLEAKGLVGLELGWIISCQV